MLTSIETTATIGSNRQLVLDEDLPLQASKKVRVIVLFDEDLDDAGWLRAGAQNAAFDFLADEGEDIYSLDDGKPFEDEA